MNEACMVIAGVGLGMIIAMRLIGWLEACWLERLEREHGRVE